MGPLLVKSSKVSKSLEIYQSIADTSLQCCFVFTSAVSPTHPDFSCCCFRSETWIENRNHINSHSLLAIRNHWREGYWLDWLHITSHTWTDSSTHTSSLMAWDPGHLSLYTHTHGHGDPRTANLWDKSHTVQWPVFTPPNVMSLSVTLSVMQTCRCSQHTHSSSPPHTHSLWWVKAHAY